MLTSSFIFLPGIGPLAERRWWDTGVIHWDSFLNQSSITRLSADRKLWYDEELRAAQSLTETGQAHLFGSRLPRREHRRLYGICLSQAGYLDIETTGASPESGEVTTVGLHRAGKTMIFVRFGPSSLSTTLQPADSQ